MIVNLILHDDSVCTVKLEVWNVLLEHYTEFNSEKLVVEQFEKPEPCTSGRPYVSWNIS